MDRDEASIGGIKKPLQPTKQLFFVTVLMDCLACVIAIFISKLTFILEVVCIVFSRLYSFRGVRLKKYPIIGFLTVILNQGGTTFFLVYHSVSKELITSVPLDGMLISTLLIGGFYPITQVYQHKQDAMDGVKTISMLLGIRGTFIFCAVLYSLSFGLLFRHFLLLNNLVPFFILQILFIPVLVYFFMWLVKVWKDESNANFEYTMKMNWIASVCTNIAFVVLIFLNQHK